MTKLELIQKLEVAKEISPVVSIEAMISLINQIVESEVKTRITQDVINEISSKIESCLDNNNGSDLVDVDNIELSLGYNNQIEIDNTYVEVSNIMHHINGILDNYVAEEEDFNV
jgi:hypothetical protein